MSDTSKPLFDLEGLSEGDVARVRAVVAAFREGRGEDAERMIEAHLLEARQRG